MASSRRADAEMETRAKTGMDLVRVRWEEAVGRLPDLWVAIGRRQHERDLVAAMEVVAEEVEFVIGIAGEHVERRVEAEDFFDGSLDGVGGEPGRVGAMLHEAFHAVSEGVNSGFVSGIQKQDAGGDQFVGGKTGTFAFGGDQFGDEIIGGGVAAVVDIASDIVAEGDGGRFGGAFSFGCTAGLVYGDHRVGPAQEIWRFGFGGAEEAGGHDGGFLGTKGREEIERGIGKLVDQVIGEGGDVGGQAGDAAAGEGAQNQGSETGVAGRFRFEEGVGLEGLEVCEVVGHRYGYFGRGLAAKAAVAEDRVDRLLPKAAGMPKASQ